MSVAQESTLVISSRVHNIRPCPNCETDMYGMPGGRDAHCANCGYKDPCCTE